jgi:hypothetical protein
MELEWIQLQAFQLSDTLYPSYEQSIWQAQQSQLRIQLEAVIYMNIK